MELWRIMPKFLGSRLEQNPEQNKARANEINKKKNPSEIYDFLAETSSLPTGWVNPIGGVNEGYDKESVTKDTRKSAELITHFVNTWIK